MGNERPYYNPETGEIKMMTEEEAKKLNEEDQERAKIPMRKLKEVR